MCYCGSLLTAVTTSNVSTNASVCANLVWTTRPWIRSRPYVAYSDVKPVIISQRKSLIQYLCISFWNITRHCMTGADINTSERKLVGTVSHVGNCFTFVLHILPNSDLTNHQQDARLLSHLLKMEHGHLM